MKGYPVSVLMISDRSPMQKHMVMAIIRPIVLLMYTDHMMERGRLWPASSISSAIGLGA